MMSDFDVFNPILLILVLNEIVVLIRIPTVFVVSEPLTCGLEVLHGHTDSFTDEITLHLTKGS